MEGVMGEIRGDINNIFNKNIFLKYEIDSNIILKRVLNLDTYLADK